MEQWLARSLGLNPPAGCDELASDVSWAWLQPPRDLVKDANIHDKHRYIV